MSATSSSPVRSGFIATTAAATGAAGMILLAALSYAQSVTAAEAIAIDPFCTSAGDPGDYPSRPGTSRRMMPAIQASRLTMRCHSDGRSRMNVAA